MPKEQNGYCFLLVFHSFDCLFTAKWFIPYPLINQTSIAFVFKLFISFQKAQVSTMCFVHFFINGLLTLYTGVLRYNNYHLKMSFSNLMS